MYFKSFLHEYTKFKRFPLRGLWQNVVIPLNVPPPSNDRSTLAVEARVIDPKRTLYTIDDAKYFAPEMLCFLPDADIELGVFEADHAQQEIAWETNLYSSVAMNAEPVYSSSTQCSSSDMEGSDSGESDVTLNDFNSYARFENDDILLCSASTPVKPMLRRRLPTVKKQKYAYVQSKVKQYVKSKATLK